MNNPFQVWAVISYGTGQFDIFSADTEEEILAYCEDEGYAVIEWNETEEAAERALRSRELREIDEQLTLRLATNGRRSL